MQNKLRKRLLPTVSCFLFALLAGGCGQDFDDSEIWSELNKQAGRLAKLETWQTQVNSNISSLQGIVNALQNADAITGVSSFATPEPGGYNITFKSGSTIRIYNGAKGNTGDKGDTGDTGAKGDTGDPGDPPVIGVAEYQPGSGVYYWTLNGYWLLDNYGDLLPVSGPKGDQGEQGPQGIPGAPGQDAVAPQVRINYTYNVWEISTDGGITWNSTGIDAPGQAGGPKGPAGAPGPQGEKGPQGGAVFAGNGVDYSHPDYVVFTLVDNTTITLPRYKPAIGIVFSQPAPFVPGETKDIYYSYGGEVPAVIRATEVPAGWTVTVDRDGMKIVVTAPAPGSSGVYEAIILVSDGRERMAGQTLRLEL